MRCGWRAKEKKGGAGVFLRPLFWSASISNGKVSDSDPIYSVTDAGRLRTVPLERRVRRGKERDMKHPQQPWKKTGLCHVCGKPTKLLIHQECGKKMDAAKKANKVATVGGRELNQQHQENSKHNAAKRRYLAGHVPKFCDA